MIPGVPTWALLSLGAALFFLGFAGLLIRRNLLVLLMCLELMLNGVNLTLVVFSRQLEALDGQMAVFFIMVVAAVETAVGLSLVIALFRTLRTVDTDALTELRE